MPKFLTDNDICILLEDIPSDTESIADSFGEDGADLTDFQDATEVPEVETTQAHSSDDSNDDSSDDEIALAHFLPVRNTADLRVRPDWVKNQAQLVACQPFDSNVGINLPDMNSPIEYFFALLPETFLEEVVQQTNLYAVQKNVTMSTPTNIDEIKVFIALNILMSVKRLPSYRDYWSSRPDLRDTFIASHMTVKRFGWLLTHMHLNDNSQMPARGDDTYDKLYKVRPLLTTLSDTFLSVYEPTEHQAVDESMIKFKGRCSFVQYMPNKPIKRGYKVWVRADSTGFVCQFQIYTGKVDTVSQNLGGRVVMDLTNTLQGKFHRIYFDNFFSSVPLMEDLLETGRYACGTTRSNRKFLPTVLSDNVMKRGDVDFSTRSDGVSCTKWKDKRAITFLSNHHDAAEMGTIERKEKDGTKIMIQCPLIVKEYNKHMGYVDKADMLKSFYEIDRKSKKWWHRIFWHFVDVSVVNAFILYNIRHPKVTQLKLFRLDVANGLIGANQGQSALGRKRSATTPPNRYKTNVPKELRFDKNAHLPVKSTSKRCAHCSTAKSPHRTRWMCVCCKVGLCMESRNCFQAYHTK